MFPVMMVMFVCYELKYPEYGFFMPYAVAVGIGVLIFATVSYFLYNPYQGIKKKVRAAKGHIQDIEKIAKKEVRKNQKTREKEEKKFPARFKVFLQDTGRKQHKATARMTKMDRLRKHKASSQKSRSRWK